MMDSSLEHTYCVHTFQMGKVSEFLCPPLIPLIPQVSEMNRFVWQDMLHPLVVLGSAKWLFPYNDVSSNVDDRESLRLKTTSGLLWQAKPERKLGRVSMLETAEYLLSLDDWEFLSFKTLVNNFLYFFKHERGKNPLRFRCEECETDKCIHP